MHTQLPLLLPIRSKQAATPTSRSGTEARLNGSKGFKDLLTEWLNLQSTLIIVSVSASKYKISSVEKDTGITTISSSTTAGAPADSSSAKTGAAIDFIDSSPGVLGSADNSSSGGRAPLPIPVQTLQALRSFPVPPG